LIDLGNPGSVQLLLGIAVSVTVVAFLLVIYITRRSRSEARRVIREALAEIDDAVAFSSEKIRELDHRIIDTLFTLSEPAAENFSLAKQFLALMQRRAEKIEALVETKKLENLFKAHRIATTPLENTGDHLSSVVFSQTVLHLNPGEFRLAIEAMLNTVEKELGGTPARSYTKTIDASGHRRRRFTIRGFIETVSGEKE
jgi:hypothetical protein